MASLAPIRAWLYAPGNNPKLLDRVFEGGADAVILDLEDAVPAAEKGRARERVAQAVRFFGRSAIHPRQVAVVNRVYILTAEVVARAPEVVAAPAETEATGAGALQLASGELVDGPGGRRAEALLRLAETLDAS